MSECAAMMADYFQALLQEAVALHQAGKLAEARATYLEILKAQPRNADALHLLGVIAHQMGDHEQAVALIGQAIALHPGNAAQYQNIALALKALQRWDEALDHYARAIAIKPDYADEAGYEIMHSRHKAGLKPDHIDVSP
jgi:tetratricopeptide (TPR) repeat protein